jgi:hypothetical protein
MAKASEADYLSRIPSKNFSGKSRFALDRYVP